MNLGLKPVSNNCGGFVLFFAGFGVLGFCLFLNGFVLLQGFFSRNLNNMWMFSVYK